MSAQRFVLNETSYFGRGSREVLGEEIKQRKFKKVLVVTDKTLFEVGVTKKVTDVLDNEGISYEIYSEVKPNPTIKNVLDGVKVCKDAKADVIVAVGRGAMSASMRTMAKELADLLGGVVACSRPLVESNVYDAKHQIGLSGRTVKPKFLICLGISGAVQFAAGMKSSDCIVAINTDKTAPIFDVAHYAVVGDVNEIVPRLINMVKEAKANV